MLKWRPGDLWVFRVFAAEFGTSDVQANYSRLYSWMANQFGHMTLGLATTLAFVWIAESVHDVIEGPGPGMSLLAYGLLCATVAAFFAAAGLVLWSGLRPKAGGGGAHPIPPEAHKNRIAPVSARLRAVLLLAALAGLGVTAITVLWAAIGGAPEAHAAVIGVVVSGALIAVAVIVLCVDRGALVLGLLAVAGATWMAVTDGAWVAAALASAFVAALALRKRGGSTLGLTLLAALGALIYVGFTEWEVANEWDLAFGAALAAVAVWWVKEFGSDIPLVSEEIARAAVARAAHCQPECDDVEDRYFRDAIWDARTDGAFYVAGAVLGAGIATRSALWSGSGWESGAEVLGLLVFGAIFLWLGRRWAYRQQALDRMAAPSASRLAVFENALQVQVYAKGALSAPLDDPLDRLLEFAQGRAMFGGHEAPEVRHMVVFGDAGSGKSPLGLAIASEAALTSIQAELALTLPDQESWRTARYITQKSLLNRATRPTHLETSAAPTQGDGAASLVVVDDADFLPKKELAKVIGQLGPETGQETVWLLDAPKLEQFTGDAPWSPQLSARMKTFLNNLSATLAEAAGDDPADVHPPLAVVFAARKS